MFERVSEKFIRSCAPSSADNRIGPEGGVAIGEGLRDNGSLQSLGLHGQWLGWGSMFE